MGYRYRIFVLSLLTLGLALSIISATDLCNFGGCNETHLYRLLGLSFPAVGVVFFVLAGILTALTRKFLTAEFYLNLLLAGAGGAEVNMILLQKNVIKAWCPVCLAIAALIYLLLLTNFVRYFLTRKEKFCMNQKSIFKPLSIVVVALLSIMVTFSGIVMPDAVAGELNLSLCNQQCKLEIYRFSGWH